MKAPRPLPRCSICRWLGHAPRVPAMRATTAARERAALLSVPRRWEPLPLNRRHFLALVPAVALPGKAPELPGVTLAGVAVPGPLRIARMGPRLVQNMSRESVYVLLERLGRERGVLIQPAGAGVEIIQPKETP